MSDTGAHASPSPAQAKPQVTIAALEDALYEMLAVGLDPCASRVTQKQIEQFLFEHARSPKSRDDFLGFFQRHGISTELDSETQPVAKGAAPAAAGDIPLQPASEPRRQLLDARRGPIGPAASAPLPAFPSEPLPAFEPELPVPEKRTGTALYLMGGVLAAIVLLLGVVAAFGYTHIVSLQQELEQTRADQELDRQAFERVDQQISTLGSRTADTGSVLANMQYKLDRVVEVVSPEPEPEPEP